MEDLQMYNEIIVKSSISGSYSAKFVNNIESTITGIDSVENAIYLIDQNVFDLHFSKKMNHVFSENFILIESTENTKTLEYIDTVIAKLVEKKFKRNNNLVAIGGGVVQDITAFIASILFRGVSWYFIPTTLLAQCDSCIGSKSSINFRGFKNLLGTFKPPVKILICPIFLDTLSEVEIRSGIGEMFHYFYTVGLEEAEEISRLFPDILNNKSLLLKFIHRSLNIKKSIIEIDEFDNGIRHIFNYGHTFGHAIESLTEYEICHGQAVTLGIDIANFISFRIGLITYEDYIQINKTISFNIPELIINNSNIDSYIEILKKDKKNIDNKLGCILPIKIGNVEKKYIEFDENLKIQLLDYFNTKIK